jgi:hypothetical protein
LPDLPDAASGRGLALPIAARLRALSVAGLKSGAKTRLPILGTHAVGSGRSAKARMRAISPL